MTTHVIHADNINTAFRAGLWWLRTAGALEATRNGPALVAPGPVITEYMRPTERVLFNPKRDCNHVFHLMEACWMLAGSNSVEWLAQFNPRMRDYAEDNGTIHGAYGWRWREAWDFDQVLEVIRVLKEDPNSRQAVISMWSPAMDLGVNKKDRPCNTHIYFDLRGGKLNMTVCCRSNDMLWGAYGANAVHLSVLQETIAAGVAAAVGIYRQISNNFHLYTEVPQAADLLANPPFEDFNRYAEGEAKVLPLLASTETPEDLLSDCEALVAGRHMMRTHFMAQVAVPLRDAYLSRKAGIAWRDLLVPVPDCDWKLGFMEWLQRREEAKDGA